MPYLSALLIIIFIGLQYKLWFGDSGVFDLLKLEKKAEQQAHLNQKLDAQNMSLIADIKELKSGDQALEEQARQTLGMIKDDEIYFQVLPPSTTIQDRN